MYEFSAAGPGTFTFDPVSKFQTIGVNNTIGASIARSVSITVINVSKREPNLEKRISIDCDDPEKSKVIRFGYLEAQIMAGLAVENINTYGSDDQLYKDCFGSNPLGVVIANFNDMAFDRGPDEFVSCRRCDGTGIFGPNHIEYCDLFFRLPTRNALCKKGSLKSHGTLGGATLLALSMSVLNAEARTLDCAKVPKFTNSEKLTNAASYSVSTQTPRCLPRTRVLTGAMTFIVLRLPSLQIHSVPLIPSTKRVTRISEEGNFRRCVRVWVVVSSCV